VEPFLASITTAASEARAAAGIMASAAAIAAFFRNFVMGRFMTIKWN
jgi:hypothetical protein